jgi:cytidylate kinase
MSLITFSRELGSNGTEIARQVSDKMGCKCFDTEAIEAMAQELGFLDDVRKADEKFPSVFKRLWSHQPTFALDRLSSVIYELAKKGECAVFIGRGSALLLETFNCTLRVRIHASVEKRIQNLVNRGYRKESARLIIERSDHDRSGFIKFAFGVDWNDEKLYDLVFNTDKLSVDLVVNMILNVARSNEIGACSVDAMRSIEVMALTHRAEAALMEAGLLASHSVTLSVSVPEPGRIELTGAVHDRTMRERAEQVLKGIKGVVSVDNKVKVFTAI